MSVTLPVPRDYDLLLSVHSWIYPDVQPVPEVTKPGSYGRILTVETVPCPVVVKQSEPGGRLRVAYSSEILNRREVKKEVRRILGLDIDTQPALDRMAKDEILSPIVSRVRGIRPYVSDTPFEALIKTMVQQQISYRAANVITKRLVLGLGATDPSLNELLYGFPRESSLITCGVDGLRAFGLGYKAECVYNVCCLVADGGLDLSRLVEMSYEEILGILGSIRGVGEWTVQTFMIAVLGDVNIFPFGDLGARNFLGHVYNAGNRMNTNQVVELSNAFGPQGPLILYLLMCADVLGLVEKTGSPKTHKR
ncbi:MAG: DNA-3-methyladenine glycosylase 2 family protein [Candidatus Thorarchaeota archaeon]|nr:MAG: DNA-3-methyladenine glycosylase 2 family protein [Candidatus Thorarchaeota archaeon]